MALNKEGLARLWAHVVSLVGGKVDKVDGKGLSTEDYTTEEKEQLASLGTLVGDTAVADQISTAIEAIEHPQSDWNANDSTAEGYVKNRTHYTVPHEIDCTANLGVTDEWRKISDTPLDETVAESFLTTPPKVIATIDGVDTEVELTWTNNWTAAYVQIVLKTDVCGFMNEEAHIRFLDVADSRDDIEAGIYVLDSSPIKTVIWYETQCLDEVYIPDSIVRASDLNEHMVSTDAHEDIRAAIPSNLVNGSAEGSLRTVYSKEEDDSYTIGTHSFAEGVNTTAPGDCAHAEGLYSGANGPFSHAEGQYTLADGDSSHAEGAFTTASGDFSHAEGSETRAAGSSAHAEGYCVTANSDFSHAEGYYTIASSVYQHVQGKYNAADAATIYSHIVGNGTGAQARSNAHTIDWSGNGWFAGDVYVGSTSGTNKDEGSKKLATEEYVIAARDQILLTDQSTGSVYRVYMKDGNLVSELA